MKKEFKLSHPKIKYARLIDAAKHDVKKYLKRERNKPLPEGADFWDFDCKFGRTAEDAQAIKVSEINACISEAEQLELASFYLEVLAKGGVRPEPKEAALQAPGSESTAAEDDDSLG